MYSPRLILPPFATTQHNVKASGIAPGNGNIERESPEWACGSDTNISPRWGFGHLNSIFPGRCPGLSHCVPLALNTSLSIATVPPDIGNEFAAARGKMNHKRHKSKESARDGLRYL